MISPRRMVSLCVLCCLGLVIRSSLAGAQTSAPPYSDPDAVGYIGLCSQTGKQVTSGSVDATPFVWRAVSSLPAKAPYSGASRTATLEAFLPVNGLAPQDWSGQTMTAASRYTDPTAPMAVATATDSSLEDFIEAFPPKWDGFVELRLYLSAANQPAQTNQYPALNIQVQGGQWYAVGGGTVDCSAGSAESLETVFDTSTTTTSTTTTVASAGGSAGGKSTSAPPTTKANAALNGHSAGTGSGSQSSSGVGRRSQASGATGASAAGISAAAAAGAVAGAVVLLAGVGGAVRSRRRRVRASADPNQIPPVNAKDDKVDQATRKGDQ